MSTSDPFQEIVDSLRSILTTSASTSTSVTITTTSSPTVVTSPVTKPAPYLGSPEDCNGFLLQCSLALKMQPHLYSTDQAKIAFIISLLTGRAVQWVEIIWTEAGSVTQSLDNFVNNFHKLFGKPAGDTSVGEQLYHLHQGKMSNNDYALKFRTLAAASGWNERSLLTYWQGLETRVRLHIAAYDDTIGLKHFIQLSIRVNNRMPSCLK